MNLIVADLPFNTRRARAQSSFAYDVFSKRDMEEAVTLMGNVVSPETNGHLFYSCPIFCHCSKSLCAATEKMKDRKGTWRESKTDVRGVRGGNHEFLRIKRPWF